MSATAPSRDAVEAVASRFAAHDHGRDLDDLDPRGVAALARAEPAFQRDRADGGPTRTKSIQDDFSAKFYRRWRTIKGLVRETVVENDALRLRDGSRNSATDASDLSVNADDPDWWAAYVDDRRAGVVQASAADGFDFPTDDDGEAIDAFLDWLRGALDDELLEADRGPNGEPINRSNWTDVFIRRALQSLTGPSETTSRRRPALDSGRFNPSQVRLKPRRANAPAKPGYASIPHRSV